MTTKSPFESLRRSDLHRLATSFHRTHLEFHNDRDLCSAYADNHVIELTRISADSEKGLAEESFRNASALSTFLSKSQDCADGSFINFFFIHQPNTWAALNVSKDMIRALIRHYEIQDGLLENLTLFRDRTSSAEEAFSGAVRSTMLADHFELGYVYKYAERKDEKVYNRNPWRIRQTGLHHVRSYDGSSSAFIIVSPYRDSIFAEDTKRLLRDSTNRSTILAHPMLVHNMLLSAYFRSWRGYLEYQETKLITAHMNTACTTLGELRVNFETLKHVRGIESNLLPLDPLLKSFKELVSVLISANKMFEQSSSEPKSSTEVIQASLNELLSECTAFREHAAYLSKRSQSIAQSISDTLSLHQSENACILAKSARDDSIAIKVLTLVASCYLPFSFVATMLGMNLVAYDQDTNDLVVSNQFWLYFAFAIPLMALTLGLCWFQMWRHNKNSPKCPVPLSHDGHELDEIV